MAVTAPNHCIGNVRCCAKPCGWKIEKLKALRQLRLVNDVSHRIRIFLYLGPRGKMRFEACVGWIVTSALQFGFHIAALNASQSSIVCTSNPQKGFLGLPTYVEALAVVSPLGSSSALAEVWRGA